MFQERKRTVLWYMFVKCQKTYKYLSSIILLQYKLVMIQRVDTLDAVDGPWQTQLKRHFVVRDPPQPLYKSECKCLTSAHHLQTEGCKRNTYTTAAENRYSDGSHHNTCYMYCIIIQNWKTNYICCCDLNISFNTLSNIPINQSIDQNTFP